MHVISWEKKRRQLLARLSECDKTLESNAPSLREKWEAQQLVLQAEQDEQPDINPGAGFRHEEENGPAAPAPTMPDAEPVALSRYVEDETPAPSPGAKSLASYLID